MNTGINSYSRPFFSLIITAGLLAGTLDILSAFTYYFIKTGKDPLNVLSFVSKTALGETAFSNTSLQQVTGLLVHFAIAFGWAILFFILYPRIKWLHFNKFITAIVYGIFVWTMMNMLILPLWNNKTFVFKPESSTINCVILIFAIGMPLSFIASKYYAKRNL